MSKKNWQKKLDKEKRRRVRQVDIGHKTTREHFVLFTLPAHTRFNEIQTRKNAIDCAKTIWELRDWHWRDQNPGLDSRVRPEAFTQFTEGLFAACPQLELIRDIAESAKHGGELGRGTVKVKAIEGAEYPGGTLRRTGPPLTPTGPFRAMHEIAKPESTLRVVLIDGSSQSLPQVLAGAVEYWRNRLFVNGSPEAGAPHSADGPQAKGA